VQDTSRAFAIANGVRQGTAISGNGDLGNIDATASSVQLDVCRLNDWRPAGNLALHQCGERWLAAPRLLRNVAADIRQPPAYVLVVAGNDPLQGRALFRKPEVSDRDCTAWLGLEDSNSEMSSQNMPLKCRTDFRDPAEFRPQRLFAFELRRWEAQLEKSIKRHRYTP
jgi:hypothetical protein